MKTTAASVCLCLLIGYTLGSFSPAYIIGRLRGYDIRNEGTGNAGASNMVLMAGKRMGTFVAVLDIAKAMFAWSLCAALFPYLRVARLLGGIGAIMGHMFPVLMSFRGGKGMACMGGVILSHSPKAFLVMLGILLCIGVMTTYISIATVSVAFIWPTYYGVTTGDLLGAGILAIPAFPILWRHQDNFRRIRNGTEMHVTGYLRNREQELSRLRK